MLQVSSKIHNDRRASSRSPETHRSSPQRGKRKSPTFSPDHDSKPAISDSSMFHVYPWEIPCFGKRRQADYNPVYRNQAQNHVQTENPFKKRPLGQPVQHERLIVTFLITIFFLNILFLVTPGVVRIFQTSAPALHNLPSQSKVVPPVSSTGRT